MSGGLRALAILSLVQAACAPTAVPATPAPASPPSAKAETAEERMGRLFEAAKAEGKLALYSSMNTDDAKAIFPKFEARFPGIKVEHTRSSSEKLVQRVVTEKRAGQDLFDAFETSIFEVKFVVDQGYTQPYRVASTEDLPPALRDPGDRWVVDRMNFNMIGVNTGKVRAGEIRTWRDLCDKRYEGRIAVEKGDVQVYSALRRQLGEQEAQSVVRCIAANKPTLRSGHTDMADFLAAGDFAIGVVLLGHQLAQLRFEKSAPVDWVRTDPIITDVQAITLANKPPHPNAAKLFTEWLISPEGQRAVADTARAPGSSKVPLKYDLVGSSKLLFVTAEMAADFEKDAEFWRSAFGIR